MGGTKAKPHDNHLKGKTSPNNPSPGTRKASRLKNIRTAHHLSLLHPPPPRFRGNSESNTKVKEPSVMAKPVWHKNRSDSPSSHPFPPPASALGPKLTLHGTHAGGLASGPLLGPEWGKLPVSCTEPNS